VYPDYNTPLQCFVPPAPKTFSTPIIKPSTPNLFAVAPAGQSELLIAIRNVVAGLRKHGVKRLIVQMGAFTKLEGDLSFGQKAMRKVPFPLVFPGFETIIQSHLLFFQAFTLATGEAGALAGNDEAAQYLRTECADIDWTIARPGMLADGPSTGTRTRR
jgi:hypothetical protein